MKASFRVLVLCLSAALCGRAMPLHAGQQPQQKIAILPLTTGGQENIDYIAEGLRDMIASRVASGSGLAVIEQAAVKAKYAGAGRETPSLEKVRGVGKSLGADYVLFGSAAAMGSDLIIAVNMLAVSGAGAPVPVFSQTLRQDEVIPRLQLIAQEVKDAAADGLMDQEEDSLPLPPAEEPKVSEGEGKAGAAAESAAGTEPPMESPDAVKPDEPGEAATGSGRDGESGLNEGIGGSAGEKGEKEGRIRDLLFKRKGDIKAPPENPAYDKSVDELEDAAEPQPKADEPSAGD